MRQTKSIPSPNCTVPCRTIYRIVPGCTIPHCTVLYRSTLYRATSYRTLSTAPFHTTTYHIGPCRTIPNRTEPPRPTYHLFYGENDRSPSSTKLLLSSFFAPPHPSSCFRLASFSAESTITTSSSSVGRRANGDVRSVTSANLVAGREKSPHALPVVALAVVAVAAAVSALVAAEPAPVVVAVVAHGLMMVAGAVVVLELVVAVSGAVAVAGLEKVARKSTRLSAAVTPAAGAGPSTRCSCGGQRALWAR